MEDYKKLVEALRCKRDDCEGCDLAFLDNDEGWMCQYAAKDDDAADAIEALQAELGQCTLFNTGLLNMREMSKEEADEILEYIRNAPVWPIEPMQIEQLPKRGEWIEEDLDNFRKYKVTCPHCGAWYVGNYDAYVEPWDFNYCPHCGNICNPTNIEYENELKEREKEAMAKMEVQDANK